MTSYRTAPDFGGGISFSVVPENSLQFHFFHPYFLFFLRPSAILPADIATVQHPSPLAPDTQSTTTMAVIVPSSYPGTYTFNSTHR